MARIVYSRKPLFLTLFIAYIISSYIIACFSFNTILYGTIALLIALSYIIYFSTRPYLSRTDSIAAITLTVAVLILGYITGLLLNTVNRLAASLYVLSSIIVYIAIIYGVTRYLA